MWLVLTLALACGPAEEPPSIAPGPSTSERLAALENDLDHAQIAWSQDKRREAVATVHAAYSRYFEPLEPALREHDPVGTLELEYRFGQLASRLGHGGDPQVLRAESDALLAQVRQAALAIAPVAQDVPPAAPVKVQGSPAAPQ